MNFLQSKIENLKTRYHINLNLVGLMVGAVFFLSVFDSIMSYIVPIVMTDSGLTDFQMGLLYASSSFFGLIFDFLLARYLTSTSYKKTFAIVLVTALLFPICMFISPQFVPFLVGMMLWGLYYNLWGFASSDFTATETKVAFHVTSVSILFFFHDIGYVVGTLGAEPLFAAFTYKQLLWILIGLVLVALLMFIPLVKKRNDVHKRSDDVPRGRPVSFATELLKLRYVGVKLLPLLILGITMSTIDAVTWTITPIIERILPALENLGGIILAVNFLPSFFAYGMAGPISIRFGKKKTGIVTFILGSVAISLLGFTQSIPLYLLISFISAFFYSIAYAAVGGAFADYLKESSSNDNEILSTHDMATNLGYVVGPILGGGLLTLLNSAILFTYIGVVAAIIGCYVLVMMPKKISFLEHNKG